MTPEKLEILKNADAIVREELDAYNEQLFERSGERNGEVVRESAGGPEVERGVWQYFAVLPDVRSVGVMGDERTYQHPIILRAVESSDAMTADWAKLPYDVLARISSRIVAKSPASTASPTTSQASPLQLLSGNSNRTFVRIFHTVSSGSDGDR